MFSKQVKLMIPFRDGVVVCTVDDELWYGEPDYSGPRGPWIWRRI